MDHKSLSFEYDKKLIERVLDDFDMRYIILFLYIIRNDLFNDLNDPAMIEAYERVLQLEDIYKSNITRFWDNNFIEVAIDLGLFKNIRSIREFEQKDDDFLIKMGDETITIENETISVPDDTLFLMINKKFKSLNRRNFNLALTKLKGVRCEVSNIIHPLIYEIGEHDYTLANDLYYLLDQFGNVYQAIKIEITIEGLFHRFKEIKENKSELLEIYHPAFSKNNILESCQIAFDSNKELLIYLKEKKVELSEKFDLDKIDKEDEIYQKWNSHLISLLKISIKMQNVEFRLNDVRSVYTGKDRKYSYLEFIEKVSFDEENMVSDLQERVVKIRNELININEELSSYNKKELKLLNLDLEKLIIMSSDESA
jgi:hypothetical protein